MWKPSLVLLVSTLSLSAPAHAGDFSQYEELGALIAQLEADHVYAPGELTTLFQTVNRQPSLLDSIAKPAESKEWKDYPPVNRLADNTQQGLSFWLQYEPVLARAESTYGVPASVIVAILGIETHYGRNKGSWKVIEALSTLGFDYPPRAPFFRKELREFLTLCKENNMDPLAVRGSYAGAMGYPQFMPSSWRTLAVNFAGNKNIDLINNPSDAIGSIANYFKANGWRTGEPVTVRARILGENYDEATSKELKTVSTLADLAKQGLTPRDPLTWPANTPVSGIRLQGANGAEFWLGFNNFYVITRYNRSILYAMAVSQLATSLDVAKKERDQGLVTPAAGNNLLP